MLSTATVARRGIGLLEVVLALAILSIAVAPVLGLFGGGRRRGVSEERLIAAHLRARSELTRALDKAERAGFAATGPLEDEPSESKGETGMSVSEEPVAELPGLWRVSARAWIRTPDSRLVPYTLTRLVHDPRAVPPAEAAGGGK